MDVVQGVFLFNYEGMLSHWIQKSMQDETNVDFLLVDRASARYKVTPRINICNI